jgi:type VII secretion protein EccB
VLALLCPQGKIGDDNKILIGKDSGAVYVMIDDVVHPALNLASARLAAGEAAKPATVKESELGKKPRGQLIGIPGAPGSLRFDKEGKGRALTVCDTLQLDGTNKATTSVLIGDVELGAKASAMESGNALLVKGKDASYLVYDNKRARVDMNNNAVTEALGIRNVAPRPISEGLLNAIPEVQRIEVPHIDDRGAQPRYDIGDHRIGEVVQDPATKQYFVVLQDGRQEISQLTANLILNSDPAAGRNPTIIPYEKTYSPISTTLPVKDYPATAPSLVQIKDRPVSCLSWKPIAAAEDSGGNHAALSMITGVGLPMREDARLVPLAQADGDGPNVDSVYFKPGSGAFVQGTGIEPDSQVALISGTSDPRGSATAEPLGRLLWRVRASGGHANSGGAAEREHANFRGPTSPLRILRSVCRPIAGCPHVPCFIAGPPWIGVFGKMSFAGRLVRICFPNIS